MKKKIALAGIALLFGLVIAGCDGPVNGGVQDQALPPLRGTVSIVGTPEVGMYLWAYTGLLEASGNVHIEWVRSGVAVGSGPAPAPFRLLDDDEGHTFIAVATGSGNSGRVASAPIGPVVFPEEYPEPECQEPDIPEMEGTLAEQLAWLREFAEAGGDYVVYVTGNENVSPAEAMLPTGRIGLTVTLRGIGEMRSVNLYGDGSLFSIGSGVTFVLGKNITLHGIHNNAAPLVQVDGGGMLRMDTGSRITGNTRWDGGGGVFIGAGGTFAMDGGEISGNTIGVQVGDGTFNMLGGKISDNTGGKGGVLVNSGGTFTMYEGELSRSSGVFVGGGGTFTMRGGMISDNHGSGFGRSNGVYVYVGGIFNMHDGKISNNIGYADISSVFVDGIFNMHGGEISKNSNVAVHIEGGTFHMHDGEISGNTNGVINYSGIFNMRGGAISDNTRFGVFNFYSRTFAMYGGKISGNNGGVDNRGAFTMRDGEIYGNSFLGVHNGHSGIFNMHGGTISGTVACADWGVGGMGVDNSGTFNMHNGSISGSIGGGVFVNDFGVFNMYGGEIFGNTAERRSGGGVFISAYGAFVMRNGTIFGNVAEANGGGVFVEGGGVFIVHNGTISGNSAAADGGGVFVTGIFSGPGIIRGAVSANLVGRNVFDMHGGTISGNTAEGRGGGVFVSNDGPFRMGGGTIHGAGTGALTNAAVAGAALHAENEGSAVYGSFNIAGTFIRSNYLNTTNNTIRVTDGVLQP